MTENFPHDDLLRLLDQVFDGGAGAAEYDRLNALLAADPEARRQYREYVLLHGNLKWHRLYGAVDAEQKEPALAEVHPAPAAPRATFWRAPLQHLTLPIGFSLLAATVTIVSFLLTTAQIRLAPRAAAPPLAPRATETPTVARLASTTDCRWSEETRPQRAGLRVGQELYLLAGVAELRFADGARLVVHGPSRLQILARGQARLDRGAVVASVADRARGFVLSTPHAEVIDLGTEFGVAVDDAGAAEVHVLSGQILLLPHDSPQAQETRLAAGEAGLVEPRQPVRPITFNARRFTSAPPRLAPYAPHGSETALVAHFEENPCRAADDWLLSSKAPLTPEAAVPGLGAATGPIVSLDQTWKSEPLSAEQIARLSSDRFTLEAWVRNPAAVVPLGSDGFYAIFQYRTKSAGRLSGLLFAVSADHRLTLFLQSQTQGFPHRAVHARPVRFQRDHWHHVAATYERDPQGRFATVQFFFTPLRDIAGGARLVERLAHQPLLPPFDPGGRVVLGGGESLNRVFGGELDEFRYTNRVLTGAEMPLFEPPPEKTSATN